jgi:hypothetical protein
VPHLTNGEIWPKVIIRTSVGSVNPLNPGPQHCQDHTDAFRKMLQTVTVVDLMEPEEILPAYQEAYLRKGATLLVEHMDFYNAK